jgi:glycosyltransferase involved in cell wall biosynthesis
MRILMVNTCTIPVFLYGGTERVMWGLAKELSKLGHEVTFLVQKGSSCDFASVLHIDESKPILDQIDSNYDVVHFHFQPEGLESFKLPYIITMHGNSNSFEALDKNTVFVSKNHAERFGSNSFVHNGLDWEEYTQPSFKVKRNYFHFLGNAAWRIKNVAGAIDVIKASKTEKIKILGGIRFNINMGLRFTFTPKASFLGMVGGKEKYKLLNGSKGLIFPVRWHEPFGLAITESLFYGCPVFGTPYGSLPELVTKDVGFLSNKKHELTEAVLNAENYSAQQCHDYAVENFNSHKMTQDYLLKYERVLSSKPLSNIPPKLKELSKSKFLDWE